MTGSATDQVRVAVLAAPTECERLVRAYTDAGAVAVPGRDLLSGNRAEPEPSALVVGDTGGPRSLAFAPPVRDRVCRQLVLHPPFALDQRDVEGIVRLSRRYRLRCVLACPWRLEPGIAKVAEMVFTGVLGAVKQIEFHGDVADCGPWAVADLWYRLTGSESVPSPRVDQDSNGAGWIRLQDGTGPDLHWHLTDARDEWSVSVSGDHGRVTCDHRGGAGTTVIRDLPDRRLVRPAPAHDHAAADIRCTLSLLARGRVPRFGARETAVLNLGASLLAVAPGCEHGNSH